MLGLGNLKCYFQLLSEPKLQFWDWSEKLQQSGYDVPACVLGTSDCPYSFLLILDFIMLNDLCIYMCVCLHFRLEIGW